MLPIVSGRGHFKSIPNWERGSVQSPKLIKYFQILYMNDQQADGSTEDPPSVEAAPDTRIYGNDCAIEILNAKLDGDFQPASDEFYNYENVNVL